MPSKETLSERELRVLEAVVRSFVESAEPAGSQTIARRYGLGVSSATVRNIMSDLEERGYLYHPHTSAGRIPTDRAYRAYVDMVMRQSPPSSAAQRALVAELGARGDAIEDLLRKATQVLGVLTHELGVAVAPALEEVVLERIELVPVASDRLLMVFDLRSGMVQTIFVRVPSAVAAGATHGVAQVLNERLAGLSLAEIRRTFPERLRDISGPAGSRELLDIFIAEGDELFSVNPPPALLGSAQLLAEQPEFASNERMRDLLDLTERRDVLRQALETRRREGLSITIGNENADSRLAEFTVVTSAYRVGELSGVIGVIGPTRMPYDKIIGLVEHTSRLVEGLLE